MRQLSSGRREVNDESVKKITLGGRKALKGFLLILAGTIIVLFVILLML
jgi:hypothetical protein